MLEKMATLEEELNKVNSKLVSIRFRIERKCIKNDAREERRQSIHILEKEKNVTFHPKKPRPSSIPTANMGMRLKVLKDIREDLLMQKSKVSDEIQDDELELDVRVNYMNHNDIQREIYDEPKYVDVAKESVHKRIGDDAEEEKDQAPLSVPSIQTSQKSQQKKGTSSF